MPRPMPPALDDPNPLHHPAANEALRMLKKAQREFVIRFPLRVNEYLLRRAELRREIAIDRGKPTSIDVLGYNISLIQERDHEYIARRMVLIATMIQEAEGEDVAR